MYYTIIPSPLGELTIATDGVAITHLHIEGDKYFASVPESWEKDSDNQLLKKAALQLNQYFKGSGKEFDLHLKPNGTEFQQSVWEKLAAVPYGTTITYGEVAAGLNNPLASRAVGSAVGKNPICLFIPCHRVTSGGGKLGGFVAGLQVKEKLLWLENSKNN